MGEIVGAGLLAHVPTIMLPESIRLEINDGKEISLVPGLRDLRRDKFDTLDYDTVVILDSHWATTVEFVVTAQDRRAGLFTSEELPRGMCRIPYDWAGDPELAHAIAFYGELIRKAIDTSTQLKDADTADIFTEVSRGSDMNLWFVEAHEQSEH